MKKKIGILMVCILTFFQVQPVKAQEIIIHIQLKDLHTKMEGVIFSFYSVGNINEYGYPELINDEEFPQTAKELSDLANRLSMSVSGNAEYTSITQKDGRANVGLMKNSIYLVTVKNNEKYGKIAPFVLVAQENMKIEPKASLFDDNSPELKPGIDTDQPNITKDVETSDHLKTSNYTLIMFTSLIVLLLVLMKKGRGNSDEEVC